MRNIAAIVKREVLSFFVSPVAYIVITGFILLSAYFFFNFLLVYNVVIGQYLSMPYRMNQPPPNVHEWVVANYYQTLMVVLVFMIPMLTMRLIAEEKRNGTFELLATSPLSVTEIVIGKFIGVSTIMTVMLLMAFCLPLLLAFFGNPELLPMLSGLLGLWLYSLALISVGMAISAFTENQIVAAIGSMVALLLLYVIHSPAESVGGVAGEILNDLSPLIQTREMLQGVINLKSLVYFVSFMGFGVFLSQRALEAHRWR